MTAGSDDQQSEAIDGVGSDESTREPTLNEGLKARLISAVILIPISLGFVYVGGWPFALSLVFVSGLMAFEWNRLVLGQENKGKITGYVLIYTALLACVLALGLAGQWAFALLLTGFTTVLVYVLAIRQRQRAPWAALGVPYLFLPMLSFIWLRAGVDGAYGIATIVWILLVVWGSDSGGYIVGKSLGGPKLAPRISPNKTWSGFAGGVALAMAAGLAMAFWVGEGSFLTFVLISAELSAISQIGDLAESSVKRHFGVKDFSSLIPGHGGVFDRFDGLLFVLMAAGLLQVWHGGTLLIWSQG